MPNRNYEAGRRYEYKIIKQLKAEGFDIVVRSAASHSPIDIWALDLKNRKIKLIQAKSGKSREAALKRLGSFDAMRGYFFVEMEAV